MIDFLERVAGATANNQDHAWEGGREFSEWLIWRFFYIAHFKLRSSDRILTHNHDQSVSARTITFHTRLTPSRCCPQSALALPRTLSSVVVHGLSSISAVASKTERSVSERPRRLFSD